MGCSASQQEGFKKDNTWLEKKVLGRKKNSFKKTSFQFAPPVDPSDNSCDLCEYDDEFRDVEITTDTSAEPLSNITNCCDVSASLITIDSPYDLDEKFEMSHTAIVRASHSSQNLHSPDVIGIPKLAMTAYPHHGNSIIPFGYGVNCHGVSNPVLHTDGATADGIHHDQHSPARNEGGCTVIDTSCDSIPSPTSVTGHSHLDGFTSSPMSPCRAARPNSMSYPYNLHCILEAVEIGSLTAMESSSSSGSDEEICLQSPSAVVLEGNGSAVKPNISLLTPLDVRTDGDEEVLQVNGEFSLDAQEDHDLPDHISFTKLILPPASEVTESPANKVILQTHIPFAHSPEISTSDLKKRGDEIDDCRHSIKSNRSSKSLPSSKDVDAIRESVKTFVDKIEVLSKGRKPPALHVNTNWEAGKSSKTLLQPLSPNKFPSRNIASVGRYGSSEKSGEVYIVGGFRDAITSTKAPPPKVKDIVAKIQSVKPVPPPRSLNQYFTPIPQKNRHRKESSDSPSRPQSVSESDEGDYTGLIVDFKGDKMLRTRSVGSLLSRTDYTVAPRASIIASKSFTFSPSRDMDIHCLTTSEVSRSKRASNRWGPVNCADITDQGTPLPETPTSGSRPFDRPESVQSLLSYAQ